MRLNIRTKLNILALILLAVPLFVLGGLGYLKSKETLDDSGLVRLENSVEMTIEMIHALNDEVESGKITLEEAQEKVLVAILGEKNADGTRPLNKNIDLGENGYMYVMDQKGVVIASAGSSEGDDFWEAETDGGFKFIQEVIVQGNDGGGVTYYDWPLPNSSEIEKKVNYSKTDPYWDWVISASSYMSDFNAPATGILYLILIVTGASLIIGTILIWIFATRISKPINMVTDQMAQLANGDLTGEDIDVTSKDEIGKLADSLNLMKKELRDIMIRLSGASSSLSSQSEELTQSANEVMIGSEQIALTMEELASGAESEANHTGELSSMMGDFSVKIQEANENGEMIHSTSNEVLSLTNRGEELMDDSASQMEKIDYIVQDAVEKVEGLDTHSKEISGLVSVIQDIADQTNLLSLNAQIEAARAGEHGQGFAVVANEVGKLADQSSRSVTNITEIVNAIQNESSTVVTSLQDGYREVEQGTSQIITTRETFNEISKAVNEMVQRIDIVSRNLTEITSTSQEMNSSIQEIAAISEESAAGVEQTSASSQQASSSMDEVTANAKQLATLAEDLSNLVEQFKI